MPPAAPPDLRHLNHVPVLDGFRGLAVLLVVAMHNFRVPLGWAGVDLFLVLSGFLITRILLNTRSRPGYLKTFYARRFLRIFPVYYLTLGLVWMFYPRADGKMWWYAAYLADFGWLAPENHVSLLVHTWSLAIEEQFYLLWPLLVGWLARGRLMQVCGALLASNLAVRLALSLTQGNDTFYSYSLLTRSDGIMAGALLALLIDGGMRHNDTNRRVASRLVAVCGVILFVLAATGQLSLSRKTVLMSLLGVPSIVFGSAAALWYAMGVSSSSPLHRFFTWKPLTFTGRISYALYLYHVPITQLGKPLLNFPETGLGRAATGVVLAVAAYTAATVSWHFFEAPINRLKRHWEYEPHREAG
ncbi:MAG: acyltransferase [Verrucomicrobia bacterium]|nr:acyltransferase [Verrucomicrobiota bacterium]